MARQKKSSIRTLANIDLTPMMDLTFILLITFIITFPLIEQGVPVNLPKGDAADVAEEDSRTISLDLDGQLYLDDIRISKEDLAEEMNTVGRMSPDAAVLVRADENIKYGSLVEIMRMLHDAKISKMALVTQASK